MNFLDQATPALKLFLLVANSMAGENSVYVWSRDHRSQIDLGSRNLCGAYWGIIEYLRQAPPQVQRDAGRPSQRQQGLLLLPHGLADGQVRKGVKVD